MRCGRALTVSVPEHVSGSKTVHWKIKRRQTANPTTVVCVLKSPLHPIININSPGHGWVTALLEDGAAVKSGSELFKFEACEHHVVMKDLCAECGANLRREGGVSGDRVQAVTAKIPMVHSVPDLHVSERVAAELALQEEQSLLASRKLILLVDLDQTILHTSNNLQSFKYKNLHRYRLPGSPLIYHTSFRPHLLTVLDCLSKYYEMHICTFGNRVYAHKLASIIDPKRRYFSHRILSRDECFNPVTKSGNLRALFPRGLNMVCIIDDRGEVWDWSPNLIHVKPYRFFPDTGDINAFPWPNPNNYRRFLDKTTAPIQPDALVKTKDSDSPAAPSLSESSEIVSDSTKTESSSVPESSPVEFAEQTLADNGSTKMESVPTGSAVSGSHVDTSNSSDTQSINEPTDTTSSASSNSNSAVDSETTTLTTDQKPQDSQQSMEDGEVSVETTADPSAATVPASPEQILEAADGNYLLRLQEILIGVHRSYFRSYDKWRARQAGSHQSHTHPDSDTGDESPSLSSTTTTSTTSSILGRASRTRPNASLPHVADVIAQHRKRVLGPKCHVTLSGLAPSHIPADRCLAGRIVRSLGAVLHFGLRLPPSVCTRDQEAAQSDPPGQTKFTDTNNTNIMIEPVKPPAALFTTHLVACRRGTEKVRAAMDLVKNTSTETDIPPLYLVSPPWLWSCHFHWQHMPEKDFPLVHDFHPSEFDSEVEPVPGTHRYARRLRRHHHHHHRPHHRHDHHHHHPPHTHRHHEHHPRDTQELTHSNSHVTQSETISSLTSLESSNLTSESENNQQETQPQHHSHRHRDHRHRRKHHHHNPKHRNNNSPEGISNKTAGTTPHPMDLEPCLDIDMVRSALDSIRAERKQDRRELVRRKHTAPSPTTAVGSVPIKRLRSSSGDSNADRDENAVVDETSCDVAPPSDADNAKSASAVDFESQNRESSSDSPSLSTSDSDVDRTDSITQSTGVTNTTISAVSSTLSHSTAVPIKLIKDADETDFDESVTLDGVDGECDVVVDDEDGQPDQLVGEGELTETTCTEDGLLEEDSDVNLREFLPPPKALILADNPLLHLPPQATSQMLAEIEDAVMEEETARAACVPAEAELYDPARLLSGLDDSSSSTDSPAPPECLPRGESPHRITSSRLDPSRSRAHSVTHSTGRTSLLNRDAQRIDFDEQTCRWQVQRQLLLRRRCRASAAEVARIDKKLRRLDASFRRESRRRRRRSADDLTETGTVRKRAVVSLAVVPDSDSDDGDIWDADYPKGWGPDDRPDHRSGSGRAHPFSASPAIHSDPEPTLDWWRSVQEEVDAADGKEWNTCPEGYDYADAERTRSMLRGDARQHDARTALYGDAHQHQGHVNLSRCLFGLDDDDEDDDENDDDDDEEDDDEDALIEPQSSSDLSTEDSNEPAADVEDLTGECWGPLREFM